jgi:hypothetical protein
VSPSRFQLEGASLDELNARVVNEYGPHAKIVAAEVVTTGGIQGFFAQRHFEVTVEVPDGSAQDAHAFDLPARAGIAALLDGADEAEASFTAGGGPRLSTASLDFATIMADLTFNTATTPDPITPRGPGPLREAGDLVVIVGLGDDPLRVARAMAAPGGSLRIAGELAFDGVPRDGIARVEDRRTTLAARAEGVERGHSTFVAFGLTRDGRHSGGLGTLAKLHADQIWVAVDAGRKQEDSARWVRTIQTAVHVDGIAVIGSDATATPETVHELAIPVGWVESVSLG